LTASRDFDMIDSTTKEISAQRGKRYDMNKYNMNKATITEKHKDLFISGVSVLRVVYDLENKKLYGVDFASDAEKSILTIPELEAKLKEYAPVCIISDYMVQQYRDFTRTINNYVKEYANSLTSKEFMLIFG
jgi:galactitol-specific phosphotransferase system IIB component